MFRQILKDNAIIIGIVVVVAVVGLIFTAVSSHAPPPPSTSIPGKTLEIGNRYKVLKVRVLEGHVFDVYLENQKRYLVALEGVIGTPPEAKEHVVRLLNKSQDEGHFVTIIPREWNDREYWWMVDMYFNSQDVTLAEWLRARELVYNQ